MGRLLLIVLFGLSSFLFIDAAPTEPVAFLKSFSGIWTGKMHSRTMRGDLVKILAVEQLYWWDEGEQVLHGMVVFNERGVRRQARSRQYVREGVIYNEVEEGSQVHLYRGRLEVDGSIQWLPTEHTHALDQQLRQRIWIAADGTSFLENVGFERYRDGPLNIVLLIDGTLRKRTDDDDDGSGDEEGL